MPPPPPHKKVPLAMQRLNELTEGKTLTDPEYTGLDVCTKDNAENCLAK